LKQSFYSYELWRVTKSTKSKTADAEQLLPILDHNANPSIIRDGYNAFHFAAQYGSAEWVKILLEYQADVTKPTIPRCETALHLATWQGDLEIFLKKLQSLQKHKIDVSAQNFDGDTALHLAITRFESVKAIEALLAAGASTEKKGRKGHTPLLYAMYLQREEKATVLLDGGANVNCQDGDGRTPLHLAIASNKMGTGLIRRLINDGADINKADRNGHTPLYDAVKLRKRDVVNMLLDCDAICELGDSGLQRYLVQVQMWRQGTRWLSSFFT
jgi:ankyrin repeat protein